MKVTFTCEKCGAELGGYDDWGCFVQDAIHVASDLSYRIDRPIDCPNCAALTYGPLTEEMVAEALYNAMQLRTGRGFAPVHWWEASDGLKDDFRRQARFVLRLLEQLYPYHDGASYVPLNRFHDADWDRWLLDLARKP